MTAQNLNEQPRPRVLVDIDEDSLRDAVLEALDGLAGTARHFPDGSMVNQNEWDAVISTRQPSSYRSATSGRSYHRVLAPHLQVFTITSPGQRFFDYVVDDETVIIYAVDGAESIGTSAYIGADLSDELVALARTQLLPLTHGRDHHRGIRTVDRARYNRTATTAPGFKPLLTGPDQLVIAAIYPRTPSTTAWAVPYDVSDLRPWFVAAFRAWHEQNPAVFPGTPDWFEDVAWYSIDELAVADKIANAQRAFAAVQEAHDAEVQHLEAELAGLRAVTADGERQLLRGQGDPLQDEVLKALRELGFDVEDMDEVWDPRERREDYRVRDEEDPDWLVIADATGTTKGVKGTKLMLVQRFVTKWVAENAGQPIPGYWVIANHFADQDPASRRPDLIRGDELAAAISEDGVVVDTVALYYLVQAVRTDPGLRLSAREQLRRARGQYTAAEAKAWVAAQASE